VFRGPKCAGLGALGPLFNKTRIKITMLIKTTAKMLLALLLVGTAEAKTVLGVSGARFTINSKPAFLLGISYYGALGAPKEYILRDLNDMQKAGFNWIRVWATWNAFGSDVSAVDANGKPRQPFMDRLKWLVSECDRRGMVVDVTLSRGGDGIQTLEAHTRAVESIVSALKNFQNWYLDLSNERNVGDKRFTSFDDLEKLLQTVRRLDPKRLVTASHAGDMDRDELRRYLFVVKVDFVAPHRPRDPESPSQTKQKTMEYLSWMKELGRIVPIHYQEPFRRDYGSWQPKAEDFLADLAASVEGGAGGWCFHNGDQKGNPSALPRRSFDMREKRLFDQLDGEERKFLGLLQQKWKAILASSPSS
jgi:hypothetical protein